MNKRGWIHILEATIAVLIVAGVMVTVYSDRTPSGVLSISDYSYSLQNEILDDIATRSDLRLEAMKVVVDLPGDPAYDILDAYVEAKIPEDFGYLLRVCNLGDTNDYCKMPSIIFYATMDKDVFVEDSVISAEVGSGGGEEAYSPKKIRLFFWDGGFPEDYCRDECDANRASLFCSSDFTKVLRNECGNFDSDSCLESGSGTEVVESCGSSEQCMDGECVESLFRKLVCPKRDYVYCDACDINPYLLCQNNGYGWWDSGSCHDGDDDEYTCYRFIESEEWESECLPVAQALPGCPTTLSACKPSSKYPAMRFYEPADSRVESCVCVPTWTPLTNTICAGTPFTQTSNCGATQPAMGTKNCVASLSASYSNLCKNCGSPPPGFGGGNWWYYDVTLSETSGDVGVTIGSRQRCYVGAISNYCDAVSTDIIAKFGSNYVSAGGSIVSTGRWTWTDEATWTPTETYWGTDSNGNAISDSYSFTVN